MSRDPYSSGSGVVGPGGGTRSPRSSRRIGELPTVDRSPSRSYASGRGSPLGRKRGTRSGNNSPEHLGYGSYHHHALGSPYYSRDEDLGSPVMIDERGRSMSTGPSVHHRSRSVSRPAMSNSAGLSTRYTSLDRASAGILDHDREFVPIRDPRERSRDRGLYLDEELYSSRSARQSPNPHMLRDGGIYIGELQHQNNDLQRELGNLKKELELTNQKLGSSMHSIKTFWSPELKKERQLRKEESTKYSLINEQLKLLNSENQKQSMMVRQLEEELRLRMRGPSIEMQQQMEVLYNENEHLTREIAILRDTIKELELRIETQKQTLQARDESIKKLLEMLQNKGMGKEEERIMFQQMQSMAQKQLDELRTEVQRRDQELLGMSAKMRTLEEQHQDYQRHIAVLKESLCAKEEHYNMLQADVEEMRQRLEEKNRLIEKKTQQAMQAQQERNRFNTELTELKDHMDIKDRKINVLQRKVDLHEANKKLQASPAKAGGDTSQQQKQLEDQRRQVEEHKKHTEEKARMVDQKARTIEEKERALQNLDQELKKRKAKMDQLEQQLQKSGGSPDKRMAELQRALETAEKDLEKAKEEAGRSTAETERLLQLMQMTQEEQNTKEKQIRDLQEALKAAQAKLKATAAQQQETPNTRNLLNQSEPSGAKPEAWKRDIETKNRKIHQLERDMTLMKKLLKRHSNPEGIQEFAVELEKRKFRIEELEDTVAEFQDFLKHNPDVKELHDLRCELADKSQRIQELEEWIRMNGERDMKIERERILELEEMVTHLEEYVKEHNVDVLKQKLKDREDRIDQLQKRIDFLEKESMRNEKIKTESAAEVKTNRQSAAEIKTDHEFAAKKIKTNHESAAEKADQEFKIKVDRESDEITQAERDCLKSEKIKNRESTRDEKFKDQRLENEWVRNQKEALSTEIKNQAESLIKSRRESMRDKIRDCGTMVDNDLDDEKILFGRQLLEKDQKMKEMEHALSEKDNRIQEYEQQVVEWQDKLNKLRKEMSSLEKELGEYEAEDIGVLKEEIRVRDEKVAQLEEEIDSLERAFNERIDLEQIEALVGLVKDKEEKEKELETDLREKRSRIEELSEALKESVIMTAEGEKKLKSEIEAKRNAIEKIGKLEQKLASIQTVSALKCPTCRPLLTKLQKSEKKLERLAEERSTQMEDLHQMKREALKAAVSEKDAHLALLELSGLKTSLQVEQAEKFKAERKMMLEKLKEEDERSIELTAESSSSSLETTSQSKVESLIDHDLDNRHRLESEDVFSNKEQLMAKGKNGTKSMKKAVRKTSTYSDRAKESR